VVEGILSKSLADNQLSLPSPFPLKAFATMAASLYQKLLEGSAAMDLLQTILEDTPVEGSGEEALTPEEIPGFVMHTIHKVSSSLHGMSGVR
jgi:hypothetical protein